MRKKTNKSKEDERNPVLNNTDRQFSAEKQKMYRRYFFSTYFISNNFKNTLHKKTISVYIEVKIPTHTHIRMHIHTKRIKNVFSMCM